MKFEKKIVSFILVLMLIVSSSPLVFASTDASGTLGTNLTWTLDSDGTLTISGTGEMAESKPWKDYKEKIKKVVIQNGVTSVAEFAFSLCNNLTSVSLGNSVTSIGYNAFDDCSSLTSISFPSKMVDISWGAFDGCNALTSFSVDSNNSRFSSDSYGCLYNKNKTELIKYPAGNTRTSFTIPSTVTTIGEEAFYRCRKLNSVTIPDSVKVISSMAFEGCALTSVSIPNGVQVIGVAAFRDCYKLKTVYLSKSVTTIESMAFDYCESLTAYTVDSSNPYFSSDSSGCLYNKNKTDLVLYPIGNARTSYTIPSTVNCICDSAFDHCEKLTAVTIPGSVNRIGEKAFWHCYQLSSINLLNEGVNIGYEAFEVTGFFENEDNWIDGALYLNNHLIYTKSSITGTYSIREGTTAIASFAFAPSDNMTGVIIPNSVKTIGEGAFFCCESLQSVTIPKNVTYIGDRPFAYCQKLTSISVNSNNSYYSSDSSGCLFNKNKSTLIQYPAGNSRANYTIPSSVNSVGYGAFYECDNLSSITIPNSVSGISDFAFYDCDKLSSISIPNGVTSINNHVFAWCKNLSSIVLPNSITRIGGSAFDATSNLKTITLPNSITSIDSYAFYQSGITSISLPSNLTTIADHIFYRAFKLNSIVIPSSVSQIESCAFDDCTNLSDVHYTGSQTQWESIDIKSNNVPLRNAEKHYNYGEYTVTYNYSYNGGTSSTTSSATVWTDDPIDLTPTATKSGWSFVGWNTNRDATKGLTSLKMGTSNVILYAIFADATKPTVSISATNDVKSSQTATLSMSDNVGVVCYYWGTSSTYTNNTAHSIGISTYYAPQETVSSPGTYYFTAVDSAGNVSTTSKTFYKTTLNAYGGSVSPSYIITMSGNSFTFPTPTWSGYSFNGWSTSSSSSSGVYSLTPTTNATYYATWGDIAKPTGSITTTNDVAASQTITITLSDNAGIAGYYWGTSSTYTSNTYTAISGAPTSKTVTIVVTAAGTYYLTVKDTSGNVSSNYSITFYKTTLNANGGSVSPTSVLTKSGNSFTFPTPTRSGYTCNGWSTSSSSSSGVYSITPTSNTTYYATWADSAKPTGSISTTNYVSASQTVTLDFSDNVGIAGYYWGTSSTYTNNTYTATSSTSVTKTISSAGTYYLTVKDTSGNVSTNYSITFYKTTLNANGGSVSPTSVLTKSGSTFTLPTPTKDKYSYIDWNEKQDGSGASYKGIYTVSANKTLYAQYHLDYHTVSFNANGGKNAPDPIEYNINLGITLPSEIPVKEYTISYNANGGTVSKNQQKVNCKFEGWDTNPSGTGTRYQAGKFYKSDNDETLYAQWSNQSAGTLESATRTGYTFKGWFTATSGGTQITGTTIISGNTDVFAQWTPNEYTVSFDANGGTCSPTSKKVTFDSSYGTLPTPVRNGYSFLGWYNSSNNRIINSSQVNAADNHTLTAHWSPKTYTITFNANGGTCATANKSVVHDDTYGELPQAIQSGYSFKGWFTQSSGGNQIVSSSIVDGTVTTLYAQWTLIPTYTIAFDANGGKGAPDPQIKTDGIDLRLTDVIPTKEYTITFDANGGKVSSNNKTVTASFDSWTASDGTTYAKGSLYKKNEGTALKAKWNEPQAGTLPNPTKDGYQFDGWYSGNTKYTSATKVTANTTLTAHWKANTYTVSFYNGIDFLGSKVLTYDKESQLTYGSTPVRSGYKFVGWEFSEDKKLYQEGQNVKNLTKENGKTLIFQAAWKKQIALEDLTYSFYNNNKAEGFGYPEDYIIPRDSYYLMFGQNILSKTLIGNAELLKSEKGITWGGNCYGMSSTTGLFNSQSGMNIADFNEFAMHVSDLRINDTSSKINNRSLTQYIESMQVSQYYSYIQRDYKGNKNKISELCKLITDAETSGEYPIIALFGPEGGHAVVGYHVEKVSSTETWIHIYDCNYPSTPRHITLYTNTNGEYTGWRYNIAEKYDDWTSTLKETDDCSISYVPYEHFKLAWEYRGRSSELTEKMKMDGVDANGDILALNSTDFVVKDFDGNTVCKAANGQFTSYDSDVYELMIAEISTANGYLLMLPADYYTVENKDKNLKLLELRIVNTDLGATVSTSADKVSIAVSDEYDVNNIIVNAGKGEKYELNLLSSMNNGYETITLSGTGDGSSIGLSCTQGQVNYSIHNSTGVTLTINGEQYNLNQGQPKTIKSVSVMSKPEKLTYQYRSNNKIDTTGLSLLVNYTDGTSEVVTDATTFTCEGLNTTKTGKQTITITYEGNTTSYDVQVRYTWWQWIIRILLLGFLWY